MAARIFQVVSGAGETIALTIIRKTDGYFWTGSAWQVGATTVATTEGASYSAAYSEYYSATAPDEECFWKALDASNNLIDRGEYHPMPDVNVKQISGDATAADNLEAMYDGTGYIADTAPASRLQITSLSVTGSSLSTPAEDDNVDGAIIDSKTFVGSQDSGTYATTSAPDGVYHDITDVGDAIDIVYQFDIGGGGLPTGVSITCIVQDLNDPVVVNAWNGSTWDVVGTITGTQAATIQNLEFSLYADGSAGSKVYIWLDGNATVSRIRIDSISVQYQITDRTVGYAEGAVWVDTNSGTAGTESFYNGTADRPCLTWAAAQTVATAVGLSRFVLISGSSITLNASADNMLIKGDGATVALGGQSCSGTIFDGVHVTGNDSGTNAENAHYHHCSINTSTFGLSDFYCCALMGDLTIAEAGTYYFEGCYSGVAGTATPSIDFGNVIGNTNVNLRHYSGGIEVKQFGDAGTDNMSLEGHGQLVINVNCTAAGTIALRGHFNVTDNVAGGFVSGGGVLSDAANFVTTAIVSDGTAINTTSGAVDLVSTVTTNTDLNTTATVEPTAAPAATATLAAKINWIFLMLKNKITTTATTVSVKADDGTTEISTSTISSDGTTATRGEYTE